MARSPSLWMDALRGVGDTLLGSVRDRLELLSVELREEKLRLIQILLWMSIAVFAGVMTLTLASVTLVYVFWAQARLVVLVTLTVVYGGLLAWAVYALRACLTAQPKPFAGTLQELTEDQACIRNDT